MGLSRGFKLGRPVFFSNQSVLKINW